MTASSMVEWYLIPRGIRDPKVLKAMAAVPRHEFVPEAFRERAYSDHPLPIGQDQTISQPYVVALMTQALELTGTERVLEIGTGSGYQTAVLAEIAKSVFSIERHLALASAARNRLENLGYHNVSVRTGNGAHGWKEYSPFDRILVTASSMDFQDFLFEQLTEGGAMVIPIDQERGEQELFNVRKKNGKPERRFICRCSFVPFVE